MNDLEAFQIAVEEARISYQEGGVPVSAAYTLYIFENIINGYHDSIPPQHNGSISSAIAMLLNVDERFGYLVLMPLRFEHCV
jgi:hypothetical protein